MCGQNFSLADYIRRYRIQAKRAVRIRFGPWPIAARSERHLVVCCLDFLQCIFLGVFLFGLVCKHNGTTVTNSACIAACESLRYLQTAAQKRCERVLADGEASSTILLLLLLRRLLGSGTHGLLRRWCRWLGRWCRWLGHWCSLWWGRLLLGLFCANGCASPVRPRPSAFGRSADQPTQTTDRILCGGGQRR